MESTEEVTQVVVLSKSGGKHRGVFIHIEQIFFSV